MRMSMEIHLSVVFFRVRRWDCINHSLKRCYPVFYMSIFTSRIFAMIELRIFLSFYQSIGRRILSIVDLSKICLMFWIDFCTFTSCSSECCSYTMWTTVAKINGTFRIEFSRNNNSNPISSTRWKDYHWLCPFFHQEKKNSNPVDFIFLFILK